MGMKTDLLAPIRIFTRLDKAAEGTGDRFEDPERWLMLLMFDTVLPTAT